MNTPKAGGHRKPSAAARHAPEGYEHMKDCPACKGTGKVRGEQHTDLRAMLIKRA